jgi:hypothetical protein
MGVLASLAVARLVARSSIVINARSIAAKVHPTMVEINQTIVEVNQTIVEVKSMTLDVKLTVVGDDSVAEEFDSIAKDIDLVLVGDSHEGPLKNRGESCLKPAKNVKRKPNLRPNAKRTLNAIHAVAAPAAHRSGPAKHPLERGPPLSRVHAALE